MVHLEIHRMFHCLPVGNGKCHHISQHGDAQVVKYLLVNIPLQIWLYYSQSHHHHIHSQPLHHKLFYWLDGELQRMCKN